MSEYTIKTVSGSVVIFNDSGNNLPLSSCKVTIPPNLDGVSSVDVVQTGANLFNEDWEVGGINDTTGLPNSDTNKIRSKTFSIIKGGTTCYVSVPQPIRVLFYASDESFISETANIRNNSFSVPSNCSLFKIRGTVDYGTTYNNDIMISYGTTATDYAPYVEPTTYTASLGRTIYGGSVDVVNGTGTDGARKDAMTSAYLNGLAEGYIGYESSVSAFDGHSAIWVRNFGYPYANQIVSGGIGCVCNHFPITMNNRSVVSSQYRIYFDVNGTGITSAQDFIDYVESLEANNDSLDIVYEVSTPEDFTFTPVPILSRLGDNTMWSDSGDIEVSYYSFVESVGRYIIFGSTLIDIANAIREKKETTAPINVNNFASEIRTISGGGGQPTLVSKTITENGTYLASDDEADGYSDVTVNVPTGASYPIAIPKLIGYNYDATNVIFTESYTTYPLLKITLASFNFTGPYYKEYSFYMTPTMIDTIFTDHTYLNFCNPYRNERVAYTKGSDSTWIRDNNITTIYVKNVYGLTFINYDVTETLLYNRNGYGSANVTFDPPAGHTFDEYDYILFSTCTSDPYYQTPSYNFYCKNLAPDTEIGSGFGDINRENFSEKCIRLTSQNTNYYCYFNKTTISSLPYSVVVALTLTPKSEAVNVPEVYEKLIADPFRAKYSTYWSDWYYCNPNSHAYVSNDTLMYDLDFRMVTRSGHEGYCFDLADLNLEEGKTYKISFDFFVSAGSWSNQYRWGLKYSPTQIESTNTAFNIDTDITFARQTGWQTVELTFTANSNNYLAFCLSDSSSTALYACKNIIFEEVT